MQEHDIANAAAALDPASARLYRLRHSLAHVLAQAVLAEQPLAKLGFGPPIDTGFYYDFDLPSPISAADLPRIEERMRAIVAEGQAFRRDEMPADAAIARLDSMGQPFKVEAARDLFARGVAAVSFYQNGPFVDMCEGPHCASTADIPADAFRLDTVAGAYWRGSEKNRMLTRIYGLAFASKAELDSYLSRRALAAERDHRKLGRHLELFHIDEEIGKGLPLWLPHGTVLRDEVEALAKEFEFRYGYVRVATPHVARQELYYRSRHLPYYREGMFPPLQIVEEEGDARREEVYYLKPMNCPFHHRIFGVRPRSCRELPLRLAEYGSLYRFEKSGELSGLMRVRGMTMNDAHIYCPQELVPQEIASILRMYRELYAILEFDRYRLRLSLHDPGRKDKYHDDEELWRVSEEVLRQTLDGMGLPYHVGPDEAAFYGPKIDVQFANLLGREETASTIQLDNVAARRFDLRYIDAHGQEQMPTVLHRAPLSTHERIVAYLIEHYGGAFPTWLAPVQVRIVTVADEVLPYARRLEEELRGDRVRAEVDAAPHSLNKKIRAGTVQKIPILLVLGRREAADGAVTVRRYRIPRQETMSFDAFRALLKAEIAARRHVKPDEADAT